MYNSTTSEKQSLSTLTQKNHKVVVDFKSRCKLFYIFYEKDLDPMMSFTGGTQWSKTRALNHNNTQSHA